MMPPVAWFAPLLAAADMDIKPGLPATVALLLMLTLLAGCVLAWFSLFKAWRRGQPATPQTPRQPVPWGLLDVVGVVLIFIALQVILSQFVEQPQLTLDPIDIQVPDDLLSADSVADATEPAYNVAAMRWLLAVNGLLQLLTMLLAIALLRLVPKARWVDLGLVAPGWHTDLWPAIKWFAAAAPLVYMLQAVLVSIQQYLGEWFAGEHPLISALRATRDPGLLLLSFLAAVIIAPLAEEFLFRVVLQGALESLLARQRGRRTPQDAGEDELSLVPPPAGDGNPFVAPQSVQVDTALPASIPPPGSSRVPVMISSLLFAAAHAGHGTSPIPLFFLSLLLGHLYHRTHRIWAPMLVHLLFNGTSMVMLWLTLAATR